MKRRSFITSLVALCLPLPKKAFNPDRFRLRGPTISGAGSELIRDLDVTYRINLAQMDAATWEQIDDKISRAELPFGSKANDLKREIEESDPYFNFYGQHCRSITTTWTDAVGNFVKSHTKIIPASTIA